MDLRTSPYSRVLSNMTSRNDRWPPRPLVVAAWSLGYCCAKFMGAGGAEEKMNLEREILGTVYLQKRGSEGEDLEKARIERLKM